MTVKWRGSKFWLGLTLAVSLILVDGQRTSTETSAQYLRNVMNELQEINSAVSADTDRNTGNFFGTNYIGNLDQTSSYRDKIHPHVHQAHSYRYSGDKEEKIPAATDTRDVDQVYLESSSHYFTIPSDRAKIPSPVKPEVPQALGFTRAQLASMYRDALEKGSAVSLTGLTSSLSSRKVPQVSTSQLLLPAAHAGYRYYFYPLKTFVNELRDVHGYKTIRDAPPEKTDVAAESSEKQMANPLFVAISSFIGLAVLFMVGVLFLPRLGGFTSRNVQDEFLQLTKVAAEAASGRDCYGRITCETSGATWSKEDALRTPRGYRWQSDTPRSNG